MRPTGPTSQLSAAMERLVRLPTETEAVGRFSPRCDAERTRSQQASLKLSLSIDVSWLATSRHSATIPDQMRAMRGSMRLSLITATDEPITSGLLVTRAEPSIVRNGPAAEALCVPEAETK
jgi:hypothetical protein